MQKLQYYLNHGLRGRRLEDLPRRAIVVAARRDEKLPCFTTTGKAGVAVRVGADRKLSHF